MDAVRFACPTCSTVLDAPPKEGVRCPRCGTAHVVEMIDDLARRLGELPRQNDEPVDLLYRRVISHLQATGLPLKLDHPPHSYFRSRELVRTLVSAGNRTGPVLIVVVGTNWTGELLQNLYTDLVEFSGELERKGSVSRFQFVTGQPIPEIYVYTFSQTDQGRFERLALSQCGLYDPEQPVAPQRVPELYALGDALMEACFGFCPSGREIADVAKIEEVILSAFRGSLPTDQERPERAFTPHTSLLLLGLLVGRVLIAAGRGAVSWMEGRGLPFGLGLAIAAGPAGAAQVNPLGKVLKFFLNGATDSVKFFTQVLLQEITRRQSGK